MIIFFSGRPVGFKYRSPENRSADKEKFYACFDKKKPGEEAVGDSKTLTPN